MKFTTKSTFQEYLAFKSLDASKMTEEEGSAAMNEFVQGLKDLLAGYEASGKASDEAFEEVEEEIKSLKSQLNGFDVKKLLKSVDEQGKFLATLKDSGSKNPINKGLRSYIEENSSVLKDMKANKSKRHDRFSFVTKDLSNFH